MGVDLSIEVFGIQFKNPIVLASGPAGFGFELQPYLDFSKIGAITLKTITVKPRDGNPPPRLVDAYGGIINSIGLQNPGIKGFITEIVPELNKLDTIKIGSIAGFNLEEWQLLVEEMDKIKEIPLIELNLSCPNIKGKRRWAEDVKLTQEVVKTARELTNKPIIVKLAPDVTDIIEIAKAAAEAGADGLTIGNGIQGMRINVETGLPVLKLKTGGLGGPAIKPITLARVFKTSEVLDIPIIGIGGIMNWQDALEYAMAGASLLGIGTAVMVDPKSPTAILSGIEAFLKRKKIERFRDIIGIAHRGGFSVS
ncbi:dihydroorotate dehydrogenase [Thermococcus sp. MV5]|uniref:dihydroorotate dehydrogenase n=1 Tax=Thermococcus sp. MV5 TaxID=1638272 RepID=UPI00143990C5|nr:dihydroorotate dehydrogenase [Thermococcus sp. MV5]NJE25343.1 dihydroorotate dehydrogenase [Thermococcus sp. MV5]